MSSHFLPLFILADLTLSKRVPPAANSRCGGSSGLGAANKCRREDDERIFMIVLQACAKVFLKQFRIMPCLPAEVAKYCVSLERRAECR